MSETFRRDLSFLEGAAESDIPVPRLTHLEAGNWRVNNSSIEAYSARAGGMGHPNGLVGLIGEQIGAENNNVGLDLAAGSNGEALRNLLDEGLIITGLMTNFEDHRSDAVRGDARLHHIAGNLVLAETWHTLLDWQEEYAPKGFAIVMHRPVGSLQDLPATTYSGAAHLLLDRTRPNGLLFAQVPRPLAQPPARFRTLCAGLDTRQDVATIRIISMAHRGNPDKIDTHAVITKRS
ncbi:MAG TPA: hypothetical protein VLH38_01470 [Patescibacteria group bacterium]|nr:hypothetical protein [Patescibacteria group bacterium]